ncbi:hypothetical protein [Arthrobacter sp. B2a2-09]|uniref:hypothetical protein n=1 Tax=Arthrobacter sp. B2a2-09 TaxID=2952822 RepID=UPI0022CD7DB9|nr:hypothetical protein [Arthrobacter sp. B2a2-09]MCZ9883435.1 hypothetical protein [Arthrobacter sp. B2a2-09]
MLFGELGPLLRPLSRRLAAAGWCAAAVGLVCGLAIAVGAGVRLSPSMQAVQAVGLAATGAAALLLGLAAACQPSSDRHVDDPEPGFQTGASDQVRSFLLAAIVMLLGVAGFAAAGWISPGGPSPQSIAFSQIFLLGAASCGLTFLLLNKVLPTGKR